MLVTMVLLFLGTIAVMSASRVVFFEQKTANNSYKNEQALAAARAGVEKGIAYLSNVSKDVLPNKDSLFDRKTRKFKGADASGAKVLPAEKLGTGHSEYVITYSQPDQANDPFLILVKAVGCAEGCGGCPADCQASATVTQLVKFRQLMPNLPDDALIARKNVKLGGSTSAQNSTGVGFAVLAGGTVDVKKVDGVVEGGLGKLQDIEPDDFFYWFFGETKADVKAAVPNLDAVFPPPGEGGIFWVNGDVEVHSNTTFGSPEDPVVIIVDGNMQLNGVITVYGVVYVVGGPGGWENSGGGNADIRGAAISEASTTSTGNLDIIKDQDVLNNIVATTRAAKVMGSWRDF